MDILIKSFNRPFYLDRCLCSIKRYVKGVRFIRVLDDGTPNKYLDEIMRRHPGVEILRSAQHAQKSDYLEHYTSSATPAPETLSLIPWDLWRSTARGGSKRFWLMEDDQWCVKAIDLQAMGEVMATHGCALVRLFKCAAFDRGEVSALSPEVARITPWYLRSRLHTHFFKAYFTNQLKLASVLNKLRIANNQWSIEAYAVYVVCGIFDQSFWLDVTSGAGGGINERVQLAKAIQWAAKHPRATFARTAGNCISTTFRSSSSSGSLDGSVGFDMILFNQLINEEWLAGGLNPCIGLPGDFPEEVLLSILKKAGNARCKPENWSRWCQQFSEFYRTLGCSLEE